MEQQKPTPEPYDIPPPTTIEAPVTIKVIKGAVKTQN